MSDGVERFHFSFTYLYIPTSQGNLKNTFVLDSSDALPGAVDLRGGNLQQELDRTGFAQHLQHPVISPAILQRPRLGLSFLPVLTAPVDAPLQTVFQCWGGRLPFSELLTGALRQSPATTAFVGVVRPSSAVCSMRFGRLCLVTYTTSAPLQENRERHRAQLVYRESLSSWAGVGFAQVCSAKPAVQSW